MPTSSRRTRRPRGSLSPELILDAAEAVAAQGFDALTMRAVAARLDAVPMALYNHFATKEQLVDALLDRVLSRFAPAPPSGDWIEDLRAFARAHRRLLAEHAWAVAPLFTQPNPGLGAVLIGEHVLGILDRGGLSKDRSVAVFSGLIALNYGWASFTAARDLDPGGPSHDVTAMLRRLPPTMFPLTVGVAEEMGAYGSDAHYELVLDQMAGRVAAVNGLDALLAEPVGVCTKGLPDSLADVPLGRIGELGLSLWAGDLLLPALTLRGDRLRHNLARMRRFCDEHGVTLAPHGKTTMAPQLFADQLAAGAWGMTAATVGQAQVMARYGVRRILIANEVLDRRAIRWLGEADADLYCLVDSVAGVEALDAAGREIKVLAEVGIAGRRGGAREDDDALRVLDAAARSRHVTPVGVECFEGVVSERGAVDALLERVAEIGASWFDGRYILSAGGSIYFDAAAGLARTGAEVVLRSGCYVAHDHGMYAASSPLTDDPFQPALELWTDVLSCPEPGRAIAGVGRRDAPYDAGLPSVLRAYRGGEPVALAEAAVTELNDQHAFITADGLQPGDLLCLGISHPCGAFDRWRTLLEVDPDYTVTRAIRTFF